MNIEITSLGSCRNHGLGEKKRIKSCPHDNKIAPAQLTEVNMRGRNSRLLRGPLQCRNTQYTWIRRTKVKQRPCSCDRLQGNWFGEIGNEEGAGCEGAGCELSLSFNCGSVSVGAGVIAAVWLSSELARGDKEGGILCTEKHMQGE